MRCSCYYQNQRKILFNLSLNLPFRSVLERYLYNKIQRSLRSINTFKKFCAMVLNKVVKHRTLYFEMHYSCYGHDQRKILYNLSINLPYGWYYYNQMLATFRKYHGVHWRVQTHTCYIISLAHRPKLMFIVQCSLFCTHNIQTMTCLRIKLCI